jgi:hypothetical protein
MKTGVASDIHSGKAMDMETLILVLVLALVVLVLGASMFGADSRPTDEDRPTPWWPAKPTN